MMISGFWPKNSLHLAVRKRSILRQRSKLRVRKLRVRKPSIGHHRKSKKRNKKKAKLLRPKLWVE